jgi:hypothetical protein
MKPYREVSSDDERAWNLSREPSIWPWFLLGAALPFTAWVVYLAIR